MDFSKLLVLGLILFLVSGCAEMQGTTSSRGYDEDYAGGSLGVMESESMSAPSATKSISNMIAAGEKIVIKKGSAEIESGQGKLDESLAKLKELISANYGSIENISYYESTSRKSYRIETRVPPASFEAISTGLKGIGNLKSMSTSSEDVTFEYIDLEAKINNLNAQKARLLEIYDKADTVENIIQVESEINRVQTQIDSASAQKRFLERQVARATLSITLYEQAPIVDQSLILPINDAFNTLIGALGVSILFVSGLVGFLIPIAILVLILWAIKRFFFKNAKIPFIGKKK